MGLLSPASQIGIRALVAAYHRVAQVYADRETIYVVQDNWPIHFHPEVLAALRPQPLKWPLHTPSNWSTEPSPQTRHLDLSIELVPLPTYAPGTNPAEKLWRWLKQDVLHLHRFAQPSSELLRRVGLQSRKKVVWPGSRSCQAGSSI